MRQWRCVFVLLAALPLAGCFISHRQFIDSDAAVYPLPASASVESYTWSDTDDQWQHEHYNTLSRNGLDYNLDDDAGKESTFRLMSLAANMWLVEAVDEDDNGFIYGLLTRNDQGQYFIRNLGDTCEQIQRAGETRTYAIDYDGMDCVIGSIYSLQTIVQSYRDRVMDEQPEWAYVIR